MALELPRKLQSALDHFFESDGSEKSIGELLADPERIFWRSPYQHGKASAASLELIRRLHSLSRTGRQLRVLAIDVDDTTPAQARETAMANSILEAQRTYAPAQTLVHVGNIHAITAGQHPFIPDLVPTGTQLREKFPDLIALYDGGPSVRRRLTATTGAPTRP